jgi:hypothetical protein
MDDLLTRVQTEADQCRNDGADDIARLLDEVAAALTVRHAPNPKLMELADRIDHEQLCRRAGLERSTWTQEQRDRCAAGVHLRRYADLLGTSSWRLYPPAGVPTCYRAATLDAVVEMARREELRR